MHDGSNADADGGADVGTVDRGGWHLVWAPGPLKQKPVGGRIILQSYWETGREYRHLSDGSCWVKG